MSKLQHVPADGPTPEGVDTAGIDNASEIQDAPEIPDVSESDYEYHEKTHLGLLIGGQMVSTLGNSLYLIVVVLYLVEITDNAALVGMYHFLTFLPGFVLAPVAGAIADRFPRKRIIVGSDLARGTIMMTAGGLIIGFAADPVIVVLVSTVFIGAGNTLFFPAVNAIVPDIIRNPGKLRRANSTRGSLVQLCNLSGNALGGGIYAIAGAPIVFLVNGGAFLVSALQEMFIRVAPDRRAGTRRSTEHERTGRPGQGAIAKSLSQLRAGLEYSFGHRNVRTIILLSFAANLLYPPIVVALPFILQDIMMLPDAVFGYMLAVTLAGGIAGYVFMARAELTGPRESQVFRLAYAVLAGGLLIASSLNAFLMFPALFLSGAAVSTIHVSSTTVLQKTISGNRRGRVFAFLEMATHLAAPLSYGLSGVFVESLRGSLDLVFPAIAAAAGILAVWVMLDGKLPSLFISGSTTGA